MSDIHSRASHVTKFRNSFDNMPRYKQWVYSIFYDDRIMKMSKDTLYQISI